MFPCSFVSTSKTRPLRLAVPRVRVRVVCVCEPSRVLWVPDVDVEVFLHPLKEL